MKFIEVENLYFDEVVRHRSLYINVDDISYVMSTCNIPKFEDARTIVMKNEEIVVVADRYKDIMDKIVRVNIKSSQEGMDNDRK